MKKHRTWHNVLRCCMKRQNSDYIKRYYDKWRVEKGLPLHRCDNKDCIYYKQKLFWLGKPLPVILDHVNGNNSDNTPGNLRYLCPNCDSMLSETRGGANKGRITRYNDNNYLISKREGTKHYYLYGSGGAVAGGSAEISFSKVKNDGDTSAESDSTLDSAKFLK